MSGGTPWVFWLVVVFFTGTLAPVVHDRVCLAVVLVLHACNPARMSVSSPQWQAPRIGTQAGMTRRPAEGGGAGVAVGSAGQGVGGAQQASEIQSLL